MDALLLACPCQTDCIEGCANCDNPICFCNVSWNTAQECGIIKVNNLFFPISIFRTIKMMIISMRALRRTVNVWDNASLIATVIAVVKSAVSPLLKTSTLNVRVKCVKFHEIFHINIFWNISYKIFQEKCPLGCPCDNYDCVLPDKKAVLTLYTRLSSQSPVLIQPNGECIILCKA